MDSSLKQTLLPDSFKVKGWADMQVKIDERSLKLICICFVPAILDTEE